MLPPRLNPTSLPRPLPLSAASCLYRILEEPMTFSNRTRWDLTENDLAAAVRAHRAAGRELADLTVSNPTLCGFDYNATQLLAPLALPSSLRYTADPLGMLAAREAVVAYYSDHSAQMSPDRICLTTSTSEAYSFLFRLLCDPGDEVLVARPSYPLFDYIAQLDNVVLREYPLYYDPNSHSDDAHSGWSIDFHALRSRVTPRTRAILLVHPNNPTGNFASATERAALETLCAEQGIALIVDEVFLDYALNQAQPTQSFTTGSPLCLTFVLSGMSKVCGLPQMKASWIAACGPDALVDLAMARLEIIADTFLSMNAPIQHALPLWLARRHSIQQQIRRRCIENLQTLDAHLAGTQACRLSLQAGWTAILRVPRTVQDQEFALSALSHGVLVQPGTFYGLPEGRAVISLLTPPVTLVSGLAGLPIGEFANGSRQHTL
jgi:alanine-synthesizing transaminase